MTVSTGPSLLRAIGVASAVVGLFGCTMLSGADELSTCSGRECAPSRRGTIEEQDPTLPASSGTARKTDADVDDDAHGDSSGGKGGADADSGSVGNGGSGDTKGSEVACGSGSCGGSQPVCCVASSKQCIGDGDACGGVRVECGGREECGAGEVCCLHQATKKAACTPDANCTGSPRIIFCRTDADCPASLRCRPTGGSFSEHGACQ